MRDGQRDQLDQVIREHLAALYGLAIRLTGDVLQAEELTQNTMLKAIRNWNDFRGDADPKTWLFTIAINAFRDQQKSPARKVVQLDNQATESAFAKTEHEPVSRSQANELGSEIAKQVAMLPARQKEVFVLSTYEGLDTKQISRMLDMTESSVYTNLHHAREFLRKQLQPFLESDQKSKNES